MAPVEESEERGYLDVALSDLDFFSTNPIPLFTLYDVRKGCNNSDVNINYTNAFRERGRVLEARGRERNKRHFT